MGEVETESGTKRNTWVYININQQLTACKLYVYRVSIYNNG